MELDSHLNPVDTFSIVLDSTLSQLHQELPSTTDQVQPLLKDVFSVKPEESKYQKSQSQTQNLIQLMDQLDPMLSWDVLAQKILSKYSILEDVIERTKAKPCQNDPIQFFQLLLLQVDELLEQIKQMLQECCVVNKAEQSASSLELTVSQSMYLFGTTGTTLNLKNPNDLPAKYKDKIFRDVSIENTVEDESHGMRTQLKKKRSRQRFSQCDKCFKSWNDVRSYELHLKEPGKCPGKPWFKLLPGKKYSCIHPMCGENGIEFSDQSHYWNHVRERHWIEEDLVINCPHCREKFPLVEMMKYHVKLSHPKTVRLFSV